MNKFKFLSVALAVGLLNAPAQASFVVGEGFDLLFTPNTGESFYQLPGPGPTLVLGSDSDNVASPICGAKAFDFGNGCVGTGQTDSIIQRKEQASVAGAGGTDTIDIELVALSLRSVDMINLGAGLETIHARVLKDIVNNVWVHGEDLGSTMSITFDDMSGGSFTSALNFRFDLFGSISGFLGSETVLFNQGGAAWSRIPPTNAVQISGVNRDLNGVDQSDDFFPGVIGVPGGPGEIGGLVEHCDPPNKCHSTRIAVAPIPAALPLLISAIGGLGFMARRRSTKSL